MAEQLYYGQSDTYDKVMRLWGQLQNWRATFASQWEEVAQLVLPTSRNTFFPGSFNWPGQKKTQEQIDSTGMLALSRFAAICDSLLTPRNMKWHGLRSTDTDLDRMREVRLWFEEVTDLLFKMRYNPNANFASQNLNVYQSLGAFGTGSMFIDELDPRYGYGLRYKALPLGETFFAENHQGMIDTVVRWWRWTPAQAKQYADMTKGSAYPFRFPETLESQLQQNSQMPVDFLHYVGPRMEYDPRRADDRGMLYESAVVCVQGKCLCQTGGYKTFPLAATRYDQTPGEVYGRGPAMQVLPTLKTINAQKRVFLKQGHRAVDPPLLTMDDGLMSLSLVPGAINPGGVNADGQPLVVPLETGNIALGKDMMDVEAQLINDAFLVTLFQILTESPQMTATEVIERTNEKGILLAPTVGRQQSEYLGPLIHREIDVLAQMGMLPPMPEVMREAGAGYEVVYTSPMARAMRAQEAGGMARMMQVMIEAVNATQDQSYTDWVNFDVALPEMADIFGVPVRWMADPRSVAAKRQARAEAQRRQEAIQAMPAEAAMMKAQNEMATQQGVA
jgi:hypothetical protein